MTGIELLKKSTRAHFERGLEKIRDKRLSEAILQSHSEYLDNKLNPKNHE